MHEIKRTMFDSFYLHKFDFRISPLADVSMPGWVGAVLRNNFLYAADSVPTGKDTTLRRTLDSSGIPADHPSFAELSGSTPKGFYISPAPSAVSLFEKQEGCICSGQWMEFSISVFGRMEIYIPAVMEAVESMCRRGFGYPMTPFAVTGIFSCLPDGNREPYTGQNLYPFRLADIQLPKSPKKNLRISLLTPTDVINVNNIKEEDGLTYQVVTSSFPSFYLIAKTALNRIEKLNTIYCDPEPLSHYDEEHSMMTSFLKTECHGIYLQSAEIFRMKANSTPKQGKKGVIPLGGYLGTLAFTGVPAELLPYLTIVQHIGIGRNLAYGNGSFRILR